MNHYNQTNLHKDNHLIIALGLLAQPCEKGLAATMLETAQCVIVVRSNITFRAR